MGACLYLMLCAQKFSDEQVYFTIYRTHLKKNFNLIKKIVSLK